MGGFALVRPPGHHALRDRAMGFCIFGNVVVAARYAQQELGIERVAIVDWDVHHGNGTEALVRGDESILFVSLHEWPFYPAPAARDTNDETIVNIPLAAGSGDAAYADAFRTIVEPAVRSFEPGLLIVSAGFDAHVDDPLAHMAVTADGFRDMAARCTQLAPQVAAVLEGGYNLETLATVSSTQRSTASARSARARNRTAKRPGCGPAVSVRFNPASSCKEPACSEYAASHVLLASPEP